jgi:ketosteroid isomerase-like protein
MKESMTIDTELVIRFFAALEAGDIDTLREIYAPDAVIWHNDDLIEQPVEDNLKVLRGLHRAVYLDSAKRASIKAAREALTG